jgi:hypothetical protein
VQGHGVAHYDLSPSSRRYELNDEGHIGLTKLNLQTGPSTFTGWEPRAKHYLIGNREEI